MQFDLYRSKSDSSAYVATTPGAGLPASPIGANDWQLLPAGAYQIIDDAADDIAKHGFCHFRLVQPD